MRVRCEPVVTFGEALEAALRERGLSGSELARRVSVSQSAVSKWIAGGSIEPANVFEVERVLDLHPGELSRLCGYLPLDAVPTSSPEDAIRTDATLSADTRDDLLVLLAQARKRRRATAKTR